MNNFNIQYKLFNTGYGQSINIVGTNIYIPFDEANTDYQQYLQWLSEGNTPLPPDEPETI
jgi:hypothetical protein